MIAKKLLPNSFLNVPIPQWIFRKRIELSFFIWNKNLGLLHYTRHSMSLSHEVMLNLMTDYNMSAPIETVIQPDTVE